MADYLLIWLREGLYHLLDINGVDHILFIISFSVVYMLKDRWRVIGMVTAFTVGHSITLGLASYGLIRINSDLVETLIPITIIATCVINLRYVGPKSRPTILTYGLAAGFGLIHGLGFSNYIRAMIMPGESFWQSLLLFNIGLEVGQIIVVAATLLLGYLVVDLAGLPRKRYIQTVSCLVALWAMYILVTL